MIELQEHEQVHFVCRRHWWIFFIVALKIAVLILILIGALLFAERFFSGMLPFSEELLVLAVVLAIEALWVALFVMIVDYYLDAWIVTNERIIFLEVHGLFNRVVTSIDYRNIQDISFRVHGILATLLNFGDVTIQSAGTQGNFNFRQVPKPNEVKEKIVSVRATFLHNERSPR